MKLLSIALLTLTAGAAFQNVNASQKTLVTPQNIGIFAACSAAIGSGVYYFIKWNNIRNADRALVKAAMIGDLTGINDALNAGARIDPSDPNFSHTIVTPLEIAIKYQQIPAIKVLLAKGATTEFHPKDIRFGMYITLLKTDNEEIFKIFAKHSERTKQLMLLSAYGYPVLIAKIQAAADSE